MVAVLVLLGIAGGVFVWHRLAIAQQVARDDADAVFCLELIYDAQQNYKMKMQIMFQGHKFTDQADMAVTPGCYACSAYDLQSKNCLNNSALQMAFSDDQPFIKAIPNLHEIPASAYRGFVFQMLRTDDAGNKFMTLVEMNNGGRLGIGSRESDIFFTMSDWGVICRPAKSGVVGAHQFFISSKGEIYRFDDPPEGDPNYGKFVLTSVPTKPLPRSQLLK